MIKLYSLPHCWKCEATKKRLNELGISFVEVVADNKEIIEYLQSKTDQLEMPILMINDMVTTLENVIKRNKDNVKYE